MNLIIRSFCLAMTCLLLALEAETVFLAFVWGFNSLLWMLNLILDIRDYKKTRSNN